MGQQRRYGKQGVDGYEVPTGGRRQQLEVAVQAIYDHVRRTGQAGIYSGDGTWRAAATDQLLAPMLEGPDRIRRGERVDGADTILAAHPSETREDIQDRLYRSRHYASPRMLTRHRIAEVPYAGIGAGLLEPVSAVQVDDTVDLVLHAMAQGRLHPRMLAAHGQGLRQWLGLPASEWTEAADYAVKRGREMCGAPDAKASEQRSGEYDENKWAL
ncbi:hypothetical protein [Actinopolymorpha pittospori]|uniref:Uncharacterized protein n=1 Tax=Actinopolymorpha pittospori TaxID=648752 RepID=A0A927RGL6_9ACTN|nr:hypothetical protein [Actinopolymorpha pittospori]MBE1604336.1 hypothetical protein [Actinopolymorpha pittospori]